MASHSVVAMIKPQVSELLVFVNHHLTHGPQRIVLYHDGPIGHLIEDGLDVDALADAGVTLVAMDEAFWQERLGARPDDFIERRRWTHANAFEICQSDWLFICDEDEFIYGDVPVSEALDSVPPSVDAVILPMAEAVWGPEDPLGAPFESRYARLPMANRLRTRIIQRIVYGRWARFFTCGCLGHHLSKQFVRRRAVFDEVGTHRCLRGGRSVSVQASDIGARIAALRMIHFDAIGFDRWKVKFESRRRDPSIARRVTARRKAQERLLDKVEGAGASEAMRIFGRLYGLTGFQKFALSGLGKLVKIESPLAAEERVRPLRPDP